MKLTKNCLLDGWVYHPTSLEDFEETQNDLSAHTFTRSDCIAGYDVMSIKGKNERTGKIVTVRLNPTKLYVKSTVVDSPDGQPRVAYCLNVGTIPLDSMGKSLDEGTFLALVSENQMFFRDPNTGKVLFPSQTLWNTFSQRVRVSKRIFDEPGLERDMYLASKMRTAPVSQFITRAVDGVECLVAMPSESYKFFPQKEIQEIYRAFKNGRFGRIEYAESVISNSRTSISFDLPEATEKVASSYSLPMSIVPGFQIETDDTCAEGLFVYGYYRINGTKVIQMHDENGKTTFIHREHRGEFSADDIIAAMDESIFQRVEILPKLLARCMNLTITPKNADLKKTNDKQLNRSTIIKAYKYVLTKTGAKKQLGTHRYDSLLDNVEGQIDPERVYSALDIALDIMSWADRMQYLDAGKPLHHDLDRELRAALADAPAKVIEFCAEQNKSIKLKD